MTRKIEWEYGRRRMRSWLGRYITRAGRKNQAFEIEMHRHPPLHDQESTKSVVPFPAQLQEAVSLSTENPQPSYVEAASERVAHPALVSEPRLMQFMSRESDPDRQQRWTTSCWKDSLFLLASSSYFLISAPWPISSDSHSSVYEQK